MIQAPDKTIYETLKSSIRDFMKYKKWTGDNFQNSERIECSHPDNDFGTDRHPDQFRGKHPDPVPAACLQNPTYSSPIINHLDNDITFKYLQGPASSITTNPEE
jgi:hypothetical protein